MVHDELEAAELFTCLLGAVGAGEGMSSTNSVPANYAGVTITNERMAPPLQVVEAW